MELLNNYNGVPIAYKNGYWIAHFDKVGFNFIVMLWDSEKLKKLINKILKEFL